MRLVSYPDDGSNEVFFLPNFEYWGLTSAYQPDYLIIYYQMQFINLIFQKKIINGAHLASATVPWHWLFFCPAPKIRVKFGCPVTKSLKAPKWHWLIVVPMGALGIGSRYLAQKIQRKRQVEMIRFHHHQSLLPQAQAHTSTEEGMQYVSMGKSQKSPVSARLC